MECMQLGHMKEGASIVTTSNHLMKWWLVNYRGYTVEISTATPERKLLGGIGYRHHWQLSKRLG